ncbi:MAG: dihydrolipoyl dehydrogenase [Halobacteriaceae archaeon]
MEDVPAETEVAVVGAGPGGYVAAIRAAQLGLDATLIERGEPGGTCLNRGCIPSKALLSATGVADRAASATEMGVHADPEVDVAAMTEWKDGVVARLTRGVEKLCKGNGVTLVEGEATFVDETTLSVSDPGGDGSATMRAAHTVVATGSRPVELPGFGFDRDRVLDAAGAMALDAAPERIVVVGGGYVGMELSTVFARLGTEVTVLEMLDGILPRFDDDLVRPVRDRATDAGVEIHTGVRADGLDDDGDQAVVRATGADGEVTVPADRVLVAVGREPVTDTLGLDAVGLDPDEDGFLPTDDRCRTPVESIYAVGDVAGEPMLAHAASHEGEVAAAAIAGEGPSLAGRAVPAAVFTDPEIATVGLTPGEADDAGLDVAVGEFPLRASGRALAAGDATGFVRVVAEAEAGRVVGGQVVGPDAAELVAELALAVELDATVADVADTVHTHPTLGEAVMEAAKNAADRAIHTLNR